MSLNQIISLILHHLLRHKWTKKNWVSLSVMLVIALLSSHGISVLGDHSAGVHPGSVYTARVNKVSDGDTITVTDAHGAHHKIRFAFIDAPEKKQASGMESLAALKRLIDGKQVQIEVTDVDRYQREVSLVSVDGLDVNYEQVKNGNAWHYTNYAKNQSSIDYSRYSAAQSAAQLARLGLWRARHPQAPWEYRAQQRSARNN